MRLPETIEARGRRTGSRQKLSNGSAGAGPQWERDGNAKLHFVPDLDFQLPATEAICDGTAPGFPETASCESRGQHRHRGGKRKLVRCRLRQAGGR